MSEVLTSGNDHVRVYALQLCFWNSLTDGPPPIDTTCALASMDGQWWIDWSQLGKPAALPLPTDPARVAEAVLWRALVAAKGNLPEVSRDRMDEIALEYGSGRASDVSLSAPFSVSFWEAEVKIWFDTEFIEDGKTIDLISIGMVREDGATLYLENSDCDHSRASDWVKANVLPHLRGGPCHNQAGIARVVQKWAGENPEFWGYFADYDWVVLCQLFGTMMDLPNGWPMYCRDIKQLCDSLGNPRLPEQGKVEHHALADAKWNRLAHEFLMARK